MLPSIDDDVRGPSLRHLNEGACRHKFNALYVGSVQQACDVSPWSLPLPSDSFSANVEFLRARGVFRELIYLLKNQMLVCDCACRKLYAFN